MSLIKCPECGRENVSDSAEMCPGCGFGIKKYFEEIKVSHIKKQEKIKSERSNETKQQLRAKNAEEIERKKEIKKYKKIQMEKELTIANLERSLEEEKKTKIVFAIVAFIGIIVTIISWEFDLGFIIVLGFFVSGFCLAALIMSKSSTENIEKDIYLAKSDYDSYQKKIDEINKLQIAKFKQDQLNKLRCPICNSINIEKITTANRMTSIAVAGLASGKIGKQYKCKNCKHMW